MTVYSIYQDGGFYDKAETLHAAIDLAEVLLGGLDEGDPSVFTVQNAAAQVVAALSNRRIIGTFFKQAWGGRKGDEAIPVGEVEFDATDAVLLMQHSDLVELEDNSEESDSLGKQHVDWDGPCSVHISDSICEFFGVSDSEEITEEALAYAKLRARPQPAEEVTVTLSIKVLLRGTPSSLNVTDFIENLDYSITSNTVGVVVRDTELVDCE